MEIIIIICVIIVLDIAFALVGLAWAVILMPIYIAFAILKKFFIPIAVIAVVLTALFVTLGAAFGVFLFLLLMLFIANSVTD